MSIFKEPPPLFSHQEETVQFFLTTPRVLCFSDAGTGKTRSVIEAIRQRKDLGKTLILAPKSILEPAWGNDIRKFAPEITYSIARAENRKQGFDADVDVVITNFDAVQWLADPAGAQSVALIALRATRAEDTPQTAAEQPVIGLLVLASPDPQRYHEGMGTAFLERLGDLASAALSHLR